MSHPSHTPTEADILSEVVGPDDPTLERQVAQAVLAVGFSESAMETMRTLLQKNNEGTITSDERGLLDRYLRVGQFLDLLQAKARLSLQRDNPAH